MYQNVGKNYQKYQKSKKVTCKWKNSVQNIKKYTKIEMLL